MSWTLVFTSHAQKDAQKLKSSGLKPKIEAMLERLRTNPFYKQPPYEALIGDFEGAYSRRINIQHRLVYQALEESKTVKILRMWTHYE